MLDGVSLAVGRGETVALVGESGCGKSVTALSILRLVPPPGFIAGGSIRFEGLELLELDEAALGRVRGARIGMIFQEPATALNPVFRVGDQLAEVVRATRHVSRKEAWEEALSLLQSVRMDDAAERARCYPHQLSGGMRQRVLIAIALAGRPSLVIADEPTTALDATIQAETLDVLRERQRADTLALLLITHDLGIVARMAGRVAVMYAGRIVEQAGCAAVFENPAHPYTRALLSAVRMRSHDGRLASIEGVVPDPASLPRGCAFLPRCPDRRPRCEEARPGATTLADGHEVRCFLYGEAS